MRCGKCYKDTDASFADSGLCPSCVWAEIMEMQYRLNKLSEEVSALVKLLADMTMRINDIDNSLGY